MGKFTSKQNTFFNTDSGAASIVTQGEFKDSQITLDKVEKAVLHSVIPESKLPRKAVGKSKTSAKFKFRIFGSTKTVSLNVNLPKAAPSKETRIYISSGAGFKPKANDVWFIFRDITHKDLVLGSMDIGSWLAIGGKIAGATKKTTVSKIKPKPCPDNEDDLYQRDLHGFLPASRTSVTYKKDKRKKSVATKALKKASYQCEINPSHETFTSTDGKPYVEAHHLVPISMQKSLGINLDRAENVVALCANCHRAVHYSDTKTRLKLLNRLFVDRESRLTSKKIKVTLAELAMMYSLL